MKVTHPLQEKKVCSPMGETVTIGNRKSLDIYVFIRVISHKGEKSPTLKVTSSKRKPPAMKVYNPRRK